MDKSKLQNELLSMKQEKESLHSELLQEKQRIVELNSQLQCAQEKSEQLTIQKEQKIIELEHALLLEKEKAENLKGELPSQSTACTNAKGQKRKNWDEYSLRHKRRKLEDVSNKAKRALNDDQFQVEGVTLRNKDTGRGLSA